jgi:hypothetical protein
MNKLIKNHADNSLEPYDLANNVGEKTNLSATSATVVRHLADKLDTWHQEGDARLPPAEGARVTPPHSFQRPCAPISQAIV